MGNQHRGGVVASAKNQYPLGYAETRHKIAMVCCRRVPCWRRRSAAVLAPQSVRVAGEEEIKLDVDW
jgi:hypothetical protein